MRCFERSLEGGDEDGCGFDVDDGGDADEFGEVTGAGPPRNRSAHELEEGGGGGAFVSFGVPALAEVDRPAAAAAGAGGGGGGGG